MAANVEYQLLSRLIDNQDFRTVQKHKIADDFFFAAECKEMFRYIFKHYHQASTYGSVPSRDLIRKRFPAFVFAPTTDSLPTLCDFLREARLSSQVQQLVQELESLAASNPREALESIRAASLNLSSQHELDDDVLLSEAVEELEQEYDLVASGLGVTGIPFPWAVLNEETQGMHEKDFICLYGRPKSLKSWIGLYIATCAYQQYRQRVLVYSLEMAPKHLVRRSAALLSCVSYSKVKKGRLLPDDCERFFATMRALKEMEAGDTDRARQAGFLITGKGGRNKGGIMSLHSKIQEFEPDLVIIDGMYLMRDDRQGTRNMDWKSMAHISQDVKETASIFNIPIIGITQGNRGSSKTGAKDADTTDIAYADALGQDADLIIRVNKEKDPTTGENELHLGFPGSRETTLDAFVIHGTPATNFQYKRAIASDETGSNGGDDGGGGGPRLNGHNKRKKGERTGAAVSGPPSTWCPPHRRPKSDNHLRLVK